MKPRVPASALAALLVACQAAPPHERASSDWLIDPAPYVARVERRADEIALANGLVRRAWRTTPELACTSLAELTTGAELLRALEPEALLTLSGSCVAVGGLLGQPDRAYLRPEWLAALTADPGAFHFVGAVDGPIAARFAWRRGRGDEGRPW